MLLMNSQINFSWLLLPVAGFSSAFVVLLALTENLIFALIWGIAATSLCTWLVMMINIRMKAMMNIEEDVELVDRNTTSDKTIDGSYSDTNTEDSIAYHFQLENDPIQ